MLLLLKPPPTRPSRLLAREPESPYPLLTASTFEGNEETGTRKLLDAVDKVVVLGSEEDRLW